MFEPGKKYKINTIKGRFYTAIVLEEDEVFIKAQDKYGEIIVIRKDLIEDSKEISE